MAAQSACDDVSEKPCAVVPTKSVPESVQRLCSGSTSTSASLEDNVEAIERKRMPT